MKAIILAFLLQLDAIGATDPALYDLRVLAAIHEPVHVALVEGRPDAVIPARFGLSTPEADQRVRAAVEAFIRDARGSREFIGAGTVDARIDLLFADGVTTPAGFGYDDFFAFAESK